jgi:hypothetical protein
MNTKTISYKNSTSKITHENLLNFFVNSTFRERYVNFHVNLHIFDKTGVLIYVCKNRYSVNYIDFSPIRGDIRGRIVFTKCFIANGCDSTRRCRLFGLTNSALLIWAINYRERDIMRLIIVYLQLCAWNLIKYDDLT